MSDPHEAPADRPAAETAEFGDRDPMSPRGTGDAVLAAAIERSLSTAATAALNIGDTSPLPIPADTANVRLGPSLDDANLALLPLIGIWRGEGKLHTPDSEAEQTFGQQLTLSHDGRGVVRHESVSWLLPQDDPAGDTVPVPDDRELGWWRPQPDGTIELILANADGVVEIYYGQAKTLSAWSLGTDAVVRTTSAPIVAGSTRLYGIVEGKLAYVIERAGSRDGVDYALQPYASALLERVAG